MELKDRNIRVNVISPGPIETPFTQPTPQGWKDALTAMVPLGGFGSPREISTAVLFLPSDDSSFITGIDLCVDGGLTQSEPAKASATCAAAILPRRRKGRALAWD